MKLFYRLFGYLLIGMIALLGTDEYFSYKAEVKQFEDDMITTAVQDGKSISGMIAHVWKESGEEKALELIHDASRSGTIRIRWVWLESLKEDPLFSPAEKELFKKLIHPKTVTLKMQKNNEDVYLYTYVPVDIGQTDQGALELSQPLVALENYSQKMMVRALTVSFLLVLISGLILYFFIDRAIRVPLNRLVAQAKRIGEGDLSVNTSVIGEDELADMATTMNDMCSRLLIAKEKIKFEYDARLKTVEQLRHTERLSTFGLISAGIAHEIGTPLNVVDGRAKMIISEDLSSVEVHDCATIIKNQAERMTLIVRQLLDFTRRPKQHVSSENISLLIKQIFQLLHPMASKQHVSFSLFKEEGTDVLLSVDSSQIQQVLVNLLMNSVQAMPDGGKAHVSLSNERLPYVHDAMQKKCNYLKIRIVDEGEGICKDDLEHIFTPFFTTKIIGTGTGLGLSISHGIIEEHGGWIDVESTVQNGACFSLFLPMKEQEN